MRRPDLQSSPADLEKPTITVAKRKRDRYTLLLADSCAMRLNDAYVGGRETGFGGLFC